MKLHARCKYCGKTFLRKSKGRLKIISKLSTGEAVVWLCPEDADKIKMVKKIDNNA